MLNNHVHAARDVSDQLSTKLPHAMIFSHPFVVRRLRPHQFSSLFLFINRTIRHPRPSRPPPKLPPSFRPCSQSPRPSTFDLPL